MIKLEKEEWLTKIPDLIYLLKKNYNFYYSGFYAKINKDILEITAKSKHNHKIVLYNKNQRFFLVVYKKNGHDIYFTNEYRNDEKNNRIQYFVKKFRRAYEKAEVENEEDYYKKL